MNTRHDHSKIRTTQFGTIGIGALLTLLGCGDVDNDALESATVLVEAETETEDDAQEDSTGDEGPAVEPVGGDIVTPPPAVAGYCHFYEHDSYGGKRLDVPHTSVLGSAGRQYNTLHNSSLNWTTGSGRPGDKISSVSCGGVSMVVYKDSQWSGDSMVVSGNIPNLHGVGFGDNISSIAAGSFPGGLCRIWENTNFTGASLLVNGAWNSLGYVGWGDRASSIRCNSAGATLCEHAQWGGTCKTMTTTEIANLGSIGMNNIIDSRR